MSIEAFRQRGIHANEALFTSTCQATRPGALTGDLDPETGLEIAEPAVDVWSGRCWFKAPSSGGQDSIGGDVVMVQKPIISLPLDAPALRMGDDIELTASRVALNVGRRFKVTALPGGDFLTIARYQVEEVIDG